MRNGDHLIRSADNPVFREHRQKLVVRAAGVSDACREHYRCRGGTTADNAQVIAR